MFSHQKRDDFFHHAGAPGHATRDEQDYYIRAERYPEYYKHPQMYQQQQQQQQFAQQQYQHYQTATSQMPYSATQYQGYNPQGFNGNDYERDRYGQRMFY